MHKINKDKMKNFFLEKYSRSIKETIKMKDFNEAGKKENRYRLNYHIEEMAN